MAKSRNSETVGHAPWFITDTKSLLSHVSNRTGDAVDDLADVVELLRVQKLYAEADRVRAIAGRLARLQMPDAEQSKENPRIRDIARGW